MKEKEQRLPKPKPTRQKGNTAKILKRGKTTSKPTPTRKKAKQLSKQMNSEGTTTSKTKANETKRQQCKDTKERKNNFQN